MNTARSAVGQVETNEDDGSQDDILPLDPSDMAYTGYADGMELSRHLLHSRTLTCVPGATETAGETFQRVNDDGELAKFWEGYYQGRRDSKYFR